MMNSIKAAVHTAARCYEPFLKVGTMADKHTFPPVSHTEMLVAKLINKYLTQEGSDYLAAGYRPVNTDSFPHRVKLAAAEAFITLASITLANKSSTRT